MLTGCARAAEGAEQQAEPPLADVSLLQTFSQPEGDTLAGAALFERSLPALAEEPSICSPAGHSHALLSQLVHHSSSADAALRPGRRPTAFRPEDRDATAGSLLATLHSRSHSSVPAERTASDTLSEKCAPAGLHLLLSCVCQTRP